MQSDTVIYEDTVMIHPDYALLTRFAMPDTSWLNLITLLALFYHVDWSQLSCDRIIVWFQKSQCLLLRLWQLRSLLDVAVSYSLIVYLIVLSIIHWYWRLIHAKRVSNENSHVEVEPQQGHKLYAIIKQDLLLLILCLVQCLVSKKINSLTHKDPQMCTGEHSSSCRT